MNIPLPLTNPTLDALEPRDSTPEKRDRTPLACSTCRSRKIRCSGGLPACNRCTTLKLPCLYKPVTTEENERAKQRKKDTRAHAALSKQLTKSVRARKNSIHPPPTPPAPTAPEPEPVELPSVIRHARGSSEYSVRPYYRQRHQSFTSSLDRDVEERLEILTSPNRYRSRTISHSQRSAVPEFEIGGPPPSLASVLGEGAVERSTGRGRQDEVMPPAFVDPWRSRASRSVDFGRFGWNSHDWSQRERGPELRTQEYHPQYYSPVQEYRGRSMDYSPQFQQQDWSGYRQPDGSEYQRRFSVDESIGGYEEQEEQEYYDEDYQGQEHHEQDYYEQDYHGQEYQEQEYHGQEY